MSQSIVARPRPDGSAPVEVIPVQGHRVMCDGGGGALGHPKVWYEMGDEGEVECLYCGRVFVQVGHGH
jgi:uncharacterized Zn-finger protein